MLREGEKHRGQKLRGFASTLALLQSWNCAGKRQKRFFKTRDEALAETQRIKMRKENHGTATKVLSPADEQQAVSAFNLLRRSGCTTQLTEIVSEHLERIRQKSASKPLGEAWDQYIKRLDTSLSASHRRNLTSAKHLFARQSLQNVDFSYWRGKREREVDLIAQVEGRLVPFEVKYRQQSTGWGELKGMVEFCTERKVALGYVIIKDSADFGVMSQGSGLENGLRVVKIPAPLACYWLGKLEMDGRWEDF